MLKDGIKQLLDECVKHGAVSQAHISNTPDRYVKALNEFFAGVEQTPEVALNTLFPAEVNEKEMIHSEDITFFSMCAHHLVPFFGKMHFAYIPNEHLVGLSKIPRLIEVYARRPQVQEKLTVDIVDAFQKIVKPEGCALMVRAYHMCCMSRGIKQPTSSTRTTALRGAFTKPDVKAEFLMSANSKDWKIF